MHIEVKLSVQKIAGNRTRKLLDPEIDWLLNKMQDRFIRSKVTPKKDGSGGFEILQDDLDAIKTLVKTGVVLPAFLTKGHRRVRCPLPGDYAYLTQDESVIKRIANTPPVVTDHIRYGIRLSIHKTAALSGFYKQVILQLNNGVVFDIGQYAQMHDAPYNGMSSAEEIYNITGLITQAAIDMGWEAYWEYYQDSYYPKNLIIFGAQGIVGTITIDGRTEIPTAGNVTIRSKDIPSAEAEYQANRLTASNIVSSLLEVAFFGTQPEFPISEIADRSLYVYPNKTFIVTNTVISYVRKPRRISLILGTDCELASEYHQLICDLAEEYFKAMIADPNWEVKLKDDMMRAPQ